MALTLEDIREMKSKIEQDKRKQERSSILMEEAKKQLKETFNCNSIKDAKEKMQDLLDQAEAEEVEIKNLLGQLEKLDQEEL